MRFISVAPLAAAAFATAGASAGPRSPIRARASRVRTSHANLAVYFVHGASAGGPVPLTLQEALAKGQVQVVETGRVNELQIENTGAEQVFIQAGDIVKGGKQDRVLTVSFLLPANSGRLPIASFCVEQGRWSARGKEDQAKFSSAGEAMPSRSALLAMAAPPPDRRPRPQPQGGPNDWQLARRHARRRASTTRSQASSARFGTRSPPRQKKLSQGLNAPVASPQSASSLQLALENEKLKEARTAYIGALQPAGEKDADIVGYVVAINGKMSAANLYPSNALFRKMWEQAAGGRRHRGDRRERRARRLPPPPPAPAPAAATEFLADGREGQDLRAAGCCRHAPGGPRRRQVAIKRVARARDSL